MFASGKLAPADSNPWTSTLCGNANPYYYAKLHEARKACREEHTIEHLHEYLDLLHVFVDEFDKSRARADANTGFASEWLDESPREKLHVRSVRGELVLCALALSRLLVAADHPRGWELAVRLQMWVVHVQLEAWTARPAVLALERASREMTALGMVRLQMATFQAWEKMGAKGKTGPGLLYWSLKQTKILALRRAALKPLVEEQTGLLCLYTHQREPEKRSVLMHKALVLFERLQMPERQNQARKMAPMLDVRLSNLSWTGILRDSVTPICPVAQNLHFQRDYAPLKTAEYQRLFHLPT